MWWSPLRTSGVCRGTFPSSKGNVHDLFNNFAEHLTQADVVCVIYPNSQFLHQLDLVSNEILNGMGAVSVHSLQGYRTEITCQYRNIWRQNLRTLMSSYDQDKFRLVLTCTRHWAKCKAIYSSVYGYFSGISCAVLVDCIVQHLMLRHRYCWRIYITLSRTGHILKK